MYTTILLNVDELWLKGKNRKHYFDTMKDHVNEVVKAYHDDKYELRNEQQRFAIHSETPFSQKLQERLQDLPGLNSVQPVRKAPLDLNKACELVVEDLRKQTHAKTFKVQAKRIDKRFPTSSMEVNRFFGGGILKNTHLKVDVHNPDILLEIKIMNDEIYLSWEKFRATGGLPVSTSGHVVTLISGGFDSPVASYMMAKRGCRQSFIFFYSYPYVGEEVKEKIIKMCSILSKYQKGCKLYIAPFGDIQNYISKHCREEYRTLLFRKYMMDVSNFLANRVKAKALLMGDSLGQVSSQTLHNMSALDHSCKKLVLRPLLGHNKIEIINLAEKIGTHDTSIIPHDDACSLFAPKHPVTRPDLEYWYKFVEEHQCRDLILNCIKSSEIVRFDIKGQIISPEMM